MARSARSITEQGVSRQERLVTRVATMPGRCAALDVSPESDGRDATLPPRLGGAPLPSLSLSLAAMVVWSLRRAS